MRTKVCIIVLLGWILSACGVMGGAGETQSPVDQPELEVEASTEETNTQTDQSTELPIAQGKFFSMSGNCALCHSGMTDPGGNDVSMPKFWRSTMMANAARDPYWQATVEHEVALNPEIRAAIEDKCATCHMPMGLVTVHAEGGQGLVLEGGFTDDKQPLHTFAMDGVSCTVCHQIREDGLGTEASFSGGFEIDTLIEMGQRIIYGPYDVTDPLNEIMRSASGFNSQKTEHMAQAALCGSCHTLYTDYLDLDSGKFAGQFAEQTPFLEWGHSSYVGEKVCQDCHMPVVEGEVQISSMGGDPRPNFSMHEFVGGNTFVLSMLRDNGEEAGVTASTEQFNDTIMRAEEQMATAAAVALENVAVTDGTATFDVLVQALTGHKFPGGFPSRRAWLHVTVRDANGEVVFESGAWTDDGAITGSDEDVSATAYEPHYDLITEPDQVQIYQPILQDSRGDVTTVLLHAAGYLKDNRLLPAGFDKATAGDDFAVSGAALEDDDFTGEGDRVTYQVAVGEASLPLSVEAELLYQSISYRWAMNLMEGEGELISQFSEYYDGAPNIPVLVAAADVVVEE